MMKLIFALATLGLGSCVTGDGAFPTMVSHGMGESTDQAAGDSIAANPFPSSRVSINRGRKAFINNCQRCHGEQGHGDGPLAEKLPSKPGNLAVLANEYPDYYFYRQIAYGQEGMPSWRDTLRDSEIWDLVNYIKTLKP